MATTFRVTEYRDEISTVFSALRHHKTNNVDSHGYQVFLSDYLMADIKNVRHMAEKYGKVKIGTGEAKSAGSCTVRLLFAQQAIGNARKKGTIGDMFLLLTGEKDWAEYRGSSHYDGTQWTYGSLSNAEMAEYWLRSYGNNIVNSMLLAVAVEEVKQAVKQGTLAAIGVPRYTNAWYEARTAQRENLAAIAERIGTTIAPSVWSDYVI